MRHGKQRCPGCLFMLPAALFRCGTQQHAVCHLCLVRGVTPPQPITVTPPPVATRPFDKNSAQEITQRLIDLAPFLWSKPITRDALFGPSRVQHIARARHLLIWALSLDSYNHGAIAEFVNRERSSVSHTITQLDTVNDTPASTERHMSVKEAIAILRGSVAMPTAHEQSDWVHPILKDHPATPPPPRQRTYYPAYSSSHG